MIKQYVANAHGMFDSEILSKIESGFMQGSKLIREYLGADKIDVVFINSPDNVIPEQGIGGYSTGPYNIYVSLDPEIQKFTQESIVLTLLHEAHHCMRSRSVGYGSTLGEALISEGLATLCEEEYSGQTPIYGRMKITQAEIEKAKKHLNDKNYIHGDWFFGSKIAQRWFGYTYGYQIAKNFSLKNNKSSVELMNTDAKKILVSVYDK